MAIIFAACYAFSKVRAVVLINAEGAPVFAFRLDKEDTFTIRFIHSWNRTPVEETYRIGAAGLEIHEALYEDFGAGMQTEIQQGQKMELIGTKLKLSGINRPVPNLTYRVGQVVANHTLIIKGKEIPLSTFVKPGSPVRFELTEIPRWKIKE